MLAVRLVKLPMELVLRLQRILENVEVAATKLTYMERRDMVANYLSKDICRQVRADMEEYNPDLGNKRWHLKGHKAF